MLRSASSRRTAGVERGYPRPACGHGEELAVAVGAPQRRRHDRNGLDSRRHRGRARPEPRTSRCTVGVTHDPAPTDPRPDPLRTGASPGARTRRRRPVSRASAGATSTSEMNERSAVGQRRPVRRSRPARGAAGSYARGPAPEDPRARPGELPPADVDGDDLARAPLEQAVGEPAGGCTRVEAAPAGHVDPGTGRARRPASRRPGRRTAGPDRRPIGSAAPTIRAAVVAGAPADA